MDILTHLDPTGPKNQLSIQASGQPCASATRRNWPIAPGSPCSIALPTSPRNVRARTRFSWGPLGQSGRRVPGAAPLRAARAAGAV